MFWVKRRAAYYVKRILDGADPADLPVEQPIQIENCLVMQAASALPISASLDFYAWSGIRG
jgi:hypothetical protein